MKADSGIEPRELRVDGGAAVNDLLMRSQAVLREQGQSGCRFDHPVQSLEAEESLGMRS